MKMYIVDLAAPWRKIRYDEVTAAGLYVRDSRRRYKIGASAFECLRHAEARQLAELEKIATNIFIRRNRPFAWGCAHEALQRIRRKTT